MTECAGAGLRPDRHGRHGDLGYYVGLAPLLARCPVKASVGVDAGAVDADICIVRSDGTELAAGRVPADSKSIASFVSSADVTECTIGLEAGETSIPIARGLRKAGYDVRILEAQRVKAFLRITQNKTDRNDARGIAEIVRSGLAVVPEVLVKSESFQLLRSELILRHRLMKQRVALENNIKSTLRLNGRNTSRIYAAGQLDRLVRAEVESLEQDGLPIGPILLPVLEVAVMLRRALEKATRRLESAARKNDVCSRLMTIPGVGPICAVSFYSAIEDPDRFTKASEVGPFFGLVPKVTQSGEVLRSGRISRRGNAMTRGHLVSAAKVFMQLDNANHLRSWVTRVSARGGRGRARVALARKLAIIMMAMWKSGATFQDRPRKTQPPVS